MPKIEPFEANVSRYEEWFERNRMVYISQIEAIRPHVPAGVKGLEIGVGTGRFASALGIDVGLEPSKNMASIASKRGIEVVYGVGERLPFADSSFDVVLMVTTLCFLDDARDVFKEANRILKQGGSFVIGFIDRDSPVGKLYQERKEKNIFYRSATFYGVDEVIHLLEEAGFEDPALTQTLFGNLKDIRTVEKPLPGYGTGSFVAVGALKK